MITFDEIAGSIRSLVGNRDDISDTIHIAINDAVRYVAGTHPDPTHLVIVDIGVEDEVTELLTTDDEPVPLLETVSAASIFNGGDYNADPRPSGNFVPLDKGNAEYFLLPGEAKLPTKWIVVGTPTGAPALRLNPPPDKLYTVRLLGYRVFPVLSGGDSLYVPDVLIPSVRMLALATVKVILGQTEDGASLSAWSSKLSKNIDGQVRTERHGHSGLKVLR